MSNKSHDESMTNIISWEEFKKREPFTYCDYEATNIQCPDCGELIFRYTKVTLATYPPTHCYKCLACGWIGTA